MTIVNFSIPVALDKKISKVIKEDGFASKAEFFRFTVMNYISVVRPSTTLIDEENKQLIREIKMELRRVYKGKKLPSLKEQLDNI